MFSKRNILLAAALLLLLALIPLTASARDFDNGDAAGALTGRALIDQFQPRQFPNERPPRDDQVAAAAAGVELGAVDALDAWYRDFYAKKEKSGPNPIAFARRMAALRQAEALGLSPKAAGLAEIGEAKMLMIPFEFAGSDDIPVCEDDLETPVTDDEGNPVLLHVEGPLHGTIPDPSLDGDNNTIWTDNFSIEWYQNLMFGNGVGVVRPDLNGGAGVDLTGISATNWYEEQSEGQYTIDGDIYPHWLQLDHSVAYYGWDGDELDPDGTGYPCGGTPSGIGNEFVIDVAKKLNEVDPDFDWAQYDTDGDQIVDHFMVIHAGIDNSAGGGAYGNLQLWAHSWDAWVPVFDDEGNFLGWQLGYQVEGMDTPDDESDDIYIVNYTHVPEDADIGVVVHEYGHDIGLPDYYDQTGVTTNSTAQWIVMSSGSWSGDLGGSHPAPFNPWARYFFGWEDPTRIDFDGPAQEFMIGQSDPTPADTLDTVWIDLPDQGVEVPNLAGDGAGLHSILGNNLVSPLGRSFELTATTAPVFTFDTSFNLEEDWDYTYVQISTDGSTWTNLLNEEGEYATVDPNSSTAWMGEGGLTGAYEGSLTYDLSAYAGASVMLRFLYTSDAGVQNAGIWLDNFSLDDGDANLYESDLEDVSDWEFEGWEVVPYENLSPHYYLLEWRNDHGSIASHGHTGQYYSLAHDQIGWKVDKFPANVPGLLIWYRNTLYSNNQAVAGGREFASPAMGPKGELLLVDSHYDPIEWSGGFWNPAAGRPGPAFSNRRSAMDGAFTLDTTPAWNLHDYAADANPVMDYGSRAAVSAFHDSMRSTPGWVYPGGSSVYRADRAASVVIPAQDVYTTRVRGLAADGMHIGDDFTAFWGFTVGGLPLGSGHPGDDWVHYGLHVEVVDQAADGSWGKVKVWNAANELDLAAAASADVAEAGDAVDFSFEGTNVGGADSFIGYAALPAGTTYVDGSAYGGLIPVGGDAAAIVAAQAAGADLSAMAAVAADEVNGFLFAYYMPTGAGGETGFSATVNEDAGSPIVATLTFFNNGYTDAPYLSSWRSVSSNAVAVQKTAALPLTADTWVNTGDAGVNYNATAILTSRSTGLDNILLTFDRSLLPAGATIVDAQLTLRNVANASGQLGKEMAVTNVSAFDSATVTGAAALAGTLSFFNPSAALPVALGPADVTVDVTAQIAAWAAGDSQLAVQTSGPAGRTNIGAMESWPAGQAATLTVVYIP